MTRRRRRAAGFAQFLILIAVLRGLTGCSFASAASTAAQPDADVLRMTSATGQAELLLVPRHAHPSGLVVFMHGVDADQNQLLDDAGLAPVRDALLAAGFALVTSAAHGNNAGNPASVQDQFDAYSDATARLGPLPRIDVLGFSMGGLDALLVAGKHVIPQLHALALLSPATDQQYFLGTRFSGTVTSAFAFASFPTAGTFTAIRAWDPLLLPARNYAPYRIAFWHSLDDHTVPYSQSLAMAHSLRAAGIDAPIHPLTGGHGNLSALDPHAVLSLFST